MTPQEFDFRGHRVAVPKSILKGWAAVSTNEVCRIMLSVELVYAMQTIKWKCAKVGPSVVATELATGEAARTAHQAFHDFLNHKRSPQKKLTIAEIKERVLCLLQFQGYRDWNRSPIATAFLYAFAVAAIEGDQHFFKALGERLKEKPIPFKAPRKFSPLAELLLEHWIVREGICLCWFSNRALKDFLKQTTHKSYTADAIRKAYERFGLPKLRLGLHKLRQPLVHSIQVEGKLILLRGGMDK